MTQLNQYAISAILHSEIVGPVRVGHGQIAAAGDAQRYFDTLQTNEPPAVLHRGEAIDFELVKKAFFEVRGAREDRGSTDLYIADPEINAEFLTACRKHGIEASDFKINKTLLNARKNKHLTKLGSAKTNVSYGDCAFASEFAATQLRYRTGASIDDILCDPVLASRFDSLARKITPGHTSLEYRWAILSIRKAGRQMKLPDKIKMPIFKTGFRLYKDSLDQIPDKSGIYLLFEKRKLLFAHSTDDIRHEIEIHRNPKVFEAIAEKLWRPDPDHFGIEYATLAQPMSILQAIERKIIEEQHPLFNVPRTAA